MENGIRPDASKQLCAAPAIMGVVMMRKIITSLGKFVLVFSILIFGLFISIVGSEEKIQIDDTSLMISDDFGSDSRDNGRALLREPIYIECNAQLKIPSKEDILYDGYPQNELGETYGPDLKELDIKPDLVLVMNDAGITGYIRWIELEGDTSGLPTEADQYISVNKVNMYLEDGKTIIGEFTIN